MDEWHGLKTAIKNDASFRSRRARIISVAIVVIGSCAPPLPLDSASSSVARIASSSRDDEADETDDVMDVKGTSSSSSTFGTDAAE
jgi:hypothetical protein